MNPPALGHQGEMLVIKLASSLHLFIDGFTSTRKSEERAAARAVVSAGDVGREPCSSAGYPDLAQSLCPFL